MLIFGESVGHDVRAPLFAIVAAMGLAVTSSVRVQQKGEQLLKLFVSFISIAAAGLSGWEWLQAADAGTAIEALGAAGAVLATLIFAANLDDEAKEEVRSDKGG